MNREGRMKRAKPQGDALASQRFRCVTATGVTHDVMIRLGFPEVVEPEGGGHSYVRCHLSLEPLAADRWISQIGEFQALCQAFEYIRTVFRVHAAEGGRIYWEDTDSPVDINSPCFSPLPSLAEIKGERGSAAIAAKPPRRKR